MPLVFSCDYCGASFKKENALVKHQLECTKAEIFYAEIWRKRQLVEEQKAAAKRAHLIVEAEEIPSIEVRRMF